MFPQVGRATRAVPVLAECLVSEARCPGADSADWEVMAALAAPVRWGKSVRSPVCRVLVG